MILVVCAVREETSFLTARRDIDLLIAGVGPVEAAIATARALALKSYACAINAGIAGAFRGKGNVGDAVVVERESLADLGVEGGARMALPDGASLEISVAADAALVRAIAARGFPVVRGLTVTNVTATDATAQRYLDTFDADVESMEGFAVLRAAAVAGVPAVEVRGISNLVGERARNEWNLRAGLRALRTILEATLEAVPRTPA